MPSYGNFFALTLVRPFLASDTIKVSVILRENGHMVPVITQNPATPLLGTYQAINFETLIHSASSESLSSIAAIAHDLNRFLFIETAKDCFNSHLYSDWLAAKREYEDSMQVTTADMYVSFSGFGRVASATYANSL